MKVLIKIRKGTRGKWWWRMVADHGTVAVGPSPGEPTERAAYEQAMSVIGAEVEDAVQVEHRHWWQWWRA